MAALTHSTNTPSRALLRRRAPATATGFFLAVETTTPSKAGRLLRAAPRGARPRSDDADWARAKSGERNFAPSEVNALACHDNVTTADAASARALHSRRALARAIEHGDALLDVLGLPPIALDALDAAIAALDEFDVPTEDLEDEGLAEAEPDDEDDGTAEDEPDLEAVNEDGDPLDLGEREDECGCRSDCDPHWWERPAHPPIGPGSHI